MRKTALFLSLALLPMSSEAVLVTPPSSAVLERDIERQYETKKITPDKEFPEIELQMPAPALQLQQGVCLSVEQIVLRGNTLISKDELSGCIAPYLHRDLTMNDIRSLSSEIESCYAAMGYFLTKVFAPEQKICDGTLTLQVVEGCIGEVTVEGNCHFKTCYIESFFCHLLGRPLCYDELVKALLLLNETQDLVAGAVFTKGKKIGCADLIIEVKDASVLHLSFSTNNYGIPSISKYRTGGRFSWGNLARQGDVLQLIGVVGTPVKNLEFIDAIYTVPLNARGTKAELSYLYSDFRVKRPKPLHLSGDTNIAALKFTQALKRARKLNTDLYGSFEYKNFRNFSFSTTTSQDDLRDATLGMIIDWLDPWCGREWFDVRGVQGIPDILGGSPAHNSHGSRKGAGGLYTRVNLDWQRIQEVGSDVFFIMEFSGQYGFDPLPLPETFYIGGADSVRGFQLAKALGDSGIRFNAEMRFAPPFIENCCIPYVNKTGREFIQFVAFADYGDVWFRHPVPVDQKNHVSMVGIGPGVRLFGPWGLSFSFDVGFPITHEGRTSHSITYVKLDWQLL